MKTLLTAISLAAFLYHGPANAQSAADNFSYKAPSGMFGEGTTKWQMYQFLESDAERTAKMRAGLPTGTGSISNSNSGGSSYPRPGESGRSPRRQTTR